MADRNLVRDLGIPLLTTLIGVGGGWTLQESQNAEAQRKAAQEREAEDLRQEKARQMDEDARAQEKRRAKAVDVDDLWRDSAKSAERDIAKRLITRLEGRNYREIMEDDSIPEEQKSALTNTLSFFAAVRGWAAAEQLDLTKTRQFLGTEPLWWSTTGIPNLLQQWGDTAMEPLLENAAYGIAALGGDLPTSVSPPLNRRWIDFMLAKADARMAPQRQMARLTSAPVAAVSTLVAQQPELDPTALAMVGQIDAPDASKTELLRCLAKAAQAAGADTQGKPLAWYESLDSNGRKPVDLRCQTRSQSGLT